MANDMWRSAADELLHSEPWLSGEEIEEMLRRRGYELPYPEGWNVITVH